MEVMTYTQSHRANQKHLGAFPGRMKAKIRSLTGIKGKSDGADGRVKRPFSDVGNDRMVAHQPKSLKVTKPISIIKESTCDLSQLRSEIDSVVIEPKIPAGVTDIDLNERDYLQEPVYAQDIMKYLRDLEKKFVISKDYLEGKEVNHNMRSVLVDWLVQVQDHQKMEQETLHLAIAFLDSFLQRRVVSVGKLQLLGVTCLLIAAKYTERFAPEIDELVRLTDNTYTFRQVIRMELVVLKVLRFELNIPEPTVFLNRYLKVVEQSNEDPLQTTMISRYLLDLSLVDTTCVSVKPSLKAAAALCLARHLVAADAGLATTWTPNLAYYTGYEHAELVPVMRRFAKLLLRAPTAQQQGAQLKFSSRSRFLSIAKWAPLESPVLLNQLLETM